LLQEQRNDVFLKDVTDDSALTKGLAQYNRIRSIWRSIRTSCPHLERNFYGLDLHDSPWNYDTRDGVTFMDVFQADYPIDILYCASNRKLSKAVIDYVSETYGQLVRINDKLASKSGEILTYGSKGEVYGILTVELMHYTKLGRMQPQDAANRLSGLISYVSKRCWS
jgi:hypothetical protein